MYTYHCEIVDLALEWCEPLQAFDTRNATTRNATTRNVCVVSMLFLACTIVDLVCILATLLARPWTAWSRLAVTGAAWFAACDIAIVLLLAVYTCAPWLAQQ
jgi:ascorbate-specific PTS system EIIC-type component UlaA